MHMITPNTIVPIESGPHRIWLPARKGVAGIMLKDGFSDEALFISRGVGVMMDVTGACVSENISGGLWQKKVLGQGIHFV